MEGEERDCMRENEKEKKRREKCKIRGQERECKGGTGQQ